MHCHGKGRPPDLAKARASLEALDRAAEVQQAKEQANADAMMEQLLAEDEEEKKAKGAAKSTKGKKAKKKRGKPAATSLGIDHELDRDAGAEADCGEARVNTTPVAPSPAAERTTALPAATEPVAPPIEAR